MKNLTAWLFLYFFGLSVTHAQTQLYGAWHKQEGDGTEKVITILPGYFAYAAFDKTGRQFKAAWGGTSQVDGENGTVKLEYNTLEKNTGTRKVVMLKVSGNQLSSNADGTTSQWQKLDDGKGALAAVWRITSRENNGQMGKMQRTARKTIKIMSGTRFQWAAVNTETGEFFGTGGGTYTFENGTYTEHIEFFPRDSTRVGASLQFKGKVTGNEWDHSGLSSRGEPIHEIWTKEND